MSTSSSSSSDSKVIPKYRTRNQEVLYRLRSIRDLGTIKSIGSFLYEFLSFKMSHEQDLIIDRRILDVIEKMWDDGKIDTHKRQECIVQVMQDFIPANKKVKSGR